FDGAAGEGELASTAHVAKLLRAPDPAGRVQAGRTVGVQLRLDVGEAPSDRPSAQSASGRREPATEAGPAGRAGGRIVVRP
ncbi:hypothetical protein ABZ896_52715, partial [Streptomyces sp. NPDC047072]|uniref:hypothetical protein n=1 Tax=Streptomyces sp. NPDC047072 TaxID=3154809 RepID=UPI0033DA1312